MTSNTPHVIQVIRHRGDPKAAVTLGGVQVNRSESIFVPQYGYSVPCTPYDDHFIYENRTPEQPSHMCTCGSAAVILTEGKQVFVCYIHLTTGKHMTGGSRWV